MGETGVKLINKLETFHALAIQCLESLQVVGGDERRYVLTILLDDEPDPTSGDLLDQGAGKLASP